jgi:hypothetical protein
MRSGRGEALNGNLIDYIVQTFIMHVVRRAMKDALFFATATGRTGITERDIQTGFMNAAHDWCNLDTDEVASETGSDDSETETVSSDGSESAGPEPESESESDGEDPMEFTTALDPMLAGAARAKAIEMKRRAYEWHAYAPSDPIELAVRNAVDLIIRRVRFRSCPA